jgi:hypothetical protein
MGLSVAVFTSSSNPIPSILHYPPSSFPGIGLSLLTHEPFATAIKQHLSNGSTLVINSLLHDLADFYRSDTLVGVVRTFYDANACPGCAAEATVQECGCKMKYNAIQTYLNRLAELAQILQEHQVHPANAVFWVSIGKRPLSFESSVVYPWQTPEVVASLMHRGAEILMSGGAVQHIDLRPPLSTSSPLWWDNPAHFSGGWKDSRGVNRDGRSMMMYTAFQILLSSLCG